MPIDYRYLGLLLRVADDPEVGIAEYAQGVRVGPGVRMPRLPALYRQKRRWRLPEQTDPLDYLERTLDEGMTWRRNYASLEQWKEQVLEVMHDQASRRQMLVLPEAEARRRYPDLVVASLGAIRKDKPNGEVTARVLFDGTHGLSVNRRTRIRYQERSPIASDLKRALREKAKLGEQTFALSADVSEAHRQVPIHPQDWHYLGCPGHTRIGRVHPHGGHVRDFFGFVLLVASSRSGGTFGTISCWRQHYYLAYAGCG